MFSKLWSDHCRFKSTCRRNLAPFHILTTTVSALVVEVPYKAKTPKSADNQLLPTAPSGLDGMRRNVMVNGYQSELLGLGGRSGRGGDGREWKAECAFDLGENWSQACRYCVCGGQQQRQWSWHQWESQRTHVLWYPHRATAHFIG